MMKKFIVGLLCVAFSVVLRAQTIEPVPTGSQWVNVSLNGAKMNTSTKAFMFYVSGQGWKSQVSQPQLKVKLDSIKRVNDSLRNIINISLSGKQPAGNYRLIGDTVTGTVTPYLLMTGLATKEPVFSKNTGFNKNFGSDPGTVAEGNHNHSGTYEPANSNIQTHISSTTNPHSVSKTQVGLGNVDNTSDASKPVSTLQQTALDLKVDKSGTKVLSDENYSSAEKTKLSGIAVGAEVNVNADWNAPSGDALILNKPDLSVFALKTYTVNGHALSGNVVVTKNDLSIDQVDNTSDVNKPISTAVQTALNSKINSSLIGQNNGVVPLGPGGTIDFQYLPSSLYINKGTWNAATNTPALANGTGVNGWVYQCVVAGTINFGAGAITFDAGDYVGYNGTIWQWAPGTKSVRSVNNQQGIVTLTTDNINEGSSNKYFSQALARGSLSFSAGSGGYNSTTGVITIPTNTNQLTNGANFLTSFTESDPTVYAWAKSATKPSYSYSEIGSHPTKLSDFTNDLGNYGGFLTGFTETDPVFTAWDKHTGISITKSQVSDFPSWSAAISKPTYNTSEVTENASYLYFTDARARSAQYTASSTVTGLLSSADWTTFNNKSNLSLGTTSATAFRGDYGQTAYDERLKWDGGSSGLNAVTARTSLGLVIGTDVLAYRTFGSAANSSTTEFRSSSWVPSWSDISGTVPTWNQNTTGTAEYANNSTQLGGQSNSEFLAYRNLLRSDVDADAIFDNRREIYNLQTGNGSGNTHFPNNSTYGTLTVLGAGSFSTQIYSTTDNDLWFRTRYIAGSINQWNHILSSVITDPLTTNKVIKWNGANAVNSLISDDGSSVTVTPNGDISELKIGYPANGLGLVWNNASGYNSIDSYGGPWELRINPRGGNILLGAANSSYNVNLRSTTASTSSTTGSLVVGGGIGVGEKITLNAQRYIGSNPITYSSSVSSGIFNSYYCDSSDGFGPYPRYLDIAAVGYPDGYNGGSNIRFLTNSITNAGNAIERVRITSSGALYVGYTSDPTSGNKLAVNGNGYFNGGLTLSSGSSASISQSFMAGIERLNIGWLLSQSDITATNTAKIVNTGSDVLNIFARADVASQVRIWTSGVERLNINSTGDVTLSNSVTGTSFLTSTGGSYNVGSSNADFATVYTRSITSNTGTITLNNNTSVSGSITASGGGFNSLRSLKYVRNDWKGSATEELSKFKPRVFNYKTRPAIDTTYAFIIDEIPQSVAKYVLMGEKKDAINVYSLHGFEIKAIQELTDENKNLKKRVGDLEKAMSGLIKQNNKRICASI